MKKIIIVYSIYMPMLAATDNVPLLAVLSGVNPMIMDTLSFGDLSRGWKVSIAQKRVDVQLKSFHLASSKHIDSKDEALTALMLLTSSIDEKCRARYPLWTDTF